MKKAAEKVFCVKIFEDISKERGTAWKRNYYG
jgi:hypothetical protein